MTKRIPTSVSSASRRTIAGRALALLVVLTSLLSASPAAADQWSVSGAVTYFGGQPAPYAKVKFVTSGGTALVVTAGQDGAFSFVAIEAGGSASAQLWSELGSCSSTPQQLMDRDITMTLTLPGDSPDC